MRVPLGTIVKDKVTGLKGVAENRATFLYGCDRYCIQPQAKEDGTVPDSIMVDEPQLEIMESEPRAMIPAGEPEQKIELGCVVEDPIRGMVGTATGRAVYLNGCSRIFVQPKQVGDKEQKSWWVDEQQLKVKTSFTGSEKRTVDPVVRHARIGGPAPSNSKY
ncbi:hypothetical protein [Zhongshania sp.]|uniref:hypothetical protein n=1 Tax=Zhongshania sp. TaxID=1971902 RepID=UPI002A822E24|nr:hypothetical protein [Zhongshania sp.]